MVKYDSYFRTIVVKDEQHLKLETTKHLAALWVGINSRNSTKPLNYIN